MSKKFNKKVKANPTITLIRFIRKLQHGEYLKINLHFNNSTCHCCTPTGIKKIEKLS